MTSLQLGSLCKGLVKVGRHLERNNPHALNRLQASALKFLMGEALSDLCLNPLLKCGSIDSSFEIVNAQVLLTNLCQDSSLEIVLRLQLLEVNYHHCLLFWILISFANIYSCKCNAMLQVIELRSLGWKPDPTVENYYKERLDGIVLCFDLLQWRREVRW